MTVRAVCSRSREVRRRAGRPSGAARRGAARRRRRRARTSPRSRSRSARSRPRAGAGRSRGRGRARAVRPCPGSTCRSSASPSAASSPIVSTPAASEPRRGARPDPRQHPDRERREERRLAPGPDDRQPAGLAAVGGDLRDDLRGRDAERAREPRARPHDRPHRLGERARVVEGGRDLAEIEIALVDPRLLDRRARCRARSTRPRASTRGRATSRGRTKTASGSGAAPRRTTSPRRSRSRRAT